MWRFSRRLRNEGVAVETQHNWQSEVEWRGFWQPVRFYLRSLLKLLISNVNVKLIPIFRSVATFFKCRFPLWTLFKVFALFFLVVSLLWRFVFAVCVCVIAPLSTITCGWQVKSSHDPIRLLQLLSWHSSCRGCSFADSAVGSSWESNEAHRNVTRHPPVGEHGGIALTGEFEAVCCIPPLSKLDYSVSLYSKPSWRQPHCMLPPWTPPPRLGIKTCSNKVYVEMV